MPDLDIVVPVFNGKETVSRLVSRIHKSLTQKGLSYRVIFIDDFSTDGTQKEIKKLAQKYPVIYHLKNGPKGNAYSVFQAAIYLESEYVVMIDADLRYPPEAIPNMLELAKRGNTGVVVGRRCYEDTSLLGSLVLKVNRLITGKLVTGLSCDTQSGLKLFRREILDHLDKDYVYSGTIDLALLHTCRELGYHVESLDVVFKNKKAGVSKIKAVGTTIQTLGEALNFRLSSKKVYNLPAEGEKMLGAGLAYKRERFITHTTLDQKISAVITFTRWQKALIITTFLSLVIGLLLSAKITAIVFIAILSAIYFADVFFNLFLVFKSLHFPPELSFSDEDLATIDESTLPVYSILCPLYHEAVVLPQFVSSINALDWPKEKLDVLLLLEEDDEKTVEVARSMNLPSYFRIVIVPDSQPKTKPKACNYGLSFAKGEYIVVYDVEDVPDPNQLKKAYLGFDRLGDKVSCLQAKLNYYNPHQNILTRLFTAEYSLWFDVMLPALQTINTTIPLGGTSNHFRTKDLVKFQGWDPFNVTEDADLGVRIFKSGGKTAIIDSTTLEEANSKLKNWIRQRSRWLKGYMQTYLVHTREPIEFIKTHKYHYLVFQLVSGLRVAFMIINPFLWVMTLSYFLLYRFVGPTIESLYPAPVFYMAVTSAVFGNFLYLYYYMVGAAKRGQYSIIKYIFLIPIYWFFTSIAAFVAFYQLLFKPYFWEKTHHGLYPVEEIKREMKFAYLGVLKNYTKKGVLLGGPMILAAVAANFLNFIYSAYLGRTITIEQFGLVSLFGGLLSFISIPTGALQGTVTYKTAYLFGKYGTPAKEFWLKVRKQIILILIIATLLWLILTPYLSAVFKSGSFLPFYLFSPVLLTLGLLAVDRGFLTGSQKFNLLAVILVVESVSKLFLTYVFVKLGLVSLVYAATPLSLLMALILAWVVSAKITNKAEQENDEESKVFPAKFYFTSIISSISYAVFMSADVIMVKYYLSPTEAGQYALLSLIGRMVFFIGALPAQFLVPLVSKVEGSGKSSNKTFYQLTVVIALFSLVAYLALGPFGFFTLPILFGEKIYPILGLVNIYGLGTVFLVLAGNIAYFRQIKKNYSFVYFSLIMAFIEVFTIVLFHSNITIIAISVSLVSVLYFITALILHIWYDKFVILGRNLVDFLGLFGKVPEVEPISGKLRILIFNWRDTKHKWAGGAEVYLQELAKRWVKSGNEVALFSGNDGLSEHHEILDGVNVIRRGGFYTVYLWAFLYYVFRLKGKYDVIIDSENGIPFFTPIYAKKPIYLLIHHVHQEVFRKTLRAPFSWFASFLEMRVMPFVYQNAEVFTVSPSSKAEILDHGLTRKEPTVIYNGVDTMKFRPGNKSKIPLVVYLGRLKFYKSLDVLVRAAKKVISTNPKVKFVIAGFGEERKKLERLAEKLGIEKSVEFVGRVSEKEKINLYQKAWVFVNPSFIEGWGITTIEANACGTPVVASNVSGLRDSVHNPHSGLLVPYGDVDEFASNIKMLIENNDLREEMSKDAISWAKNFDWNESAREVINIIKSVQVSS